MVLKTFLLFGLLILTEGFNLAEDEWEELGPDVAALHRLRGLSHHMSHHSLQGFSAQRQTRRARAAGLRADDPMSWLKTLQRCDNFTSCVSRREQDFDNFLAKIEEQKVEDWLISASEISHSYSQKLLVLTDEEKSTKARAQQEYYTDPHYSAIISKGCLLNDSCLPEVDSSTVVKVFGRVSEDGLTVSDLSGSALADLLLTTPLRAAPVFSLDGNTTTDFQHSFIRVSMARALQAVLEINHGNHHIYQVMDQPNSVSSYQIPQRAVDHSTQYDHQQIVILEDHPVVRQAATSLYEKHPSVSSVYQLDQNHRLKLIHGESTPLSADSRLVLVGHGVRDGSGEMRLAGFTPEDVSRIIQRTSRVSNTIKTTSVVGCEVGSDPNFIKSLLKELQTAGIKTKLHARNAVVQVRHTGEKITQELSPDGVQWKHKDDSKKVVATLDRNGEVVIRNEAGSKGEAVFTNERNFLVKPKKGQNKNQGAQANVDTNIWPEEPRRFVNLDIFEGGNKHEVYQRKNYMEELEGLTWALFHPDQPPPRKIRLNNNQPLREQFTIAERDGNNIRWMDNEEQIRRVLQECYEVRSGEDVRNVVRHYAKNRENKVTYVMVDDWILKIDPESLYAFPVGKKLDNNQMGNNNRIEEVRGYIKRQVGKESYTAMRGAITKKGEYVAFVRSIFQGEQLRLPAATKAWYATYFTASIISESARNFRTLPLTLMALELAGNFDPKGTKFFFEDHPMARGGSWVNGDKRGFSGAADPGDSSKLNNLKEVANLEMDFFTKWMKTVDQNKVLGSMRELAQKYKVFTDDAPAQSFTEDYNKFREMIEAQQPKASGSLGGHGDGYVTLRDLNSASELESSFKHESYFSRASASITEEIRVKLTEKYGENLAKWRVKEGTAKLENGEFVCQLVPEGADAQPIEFRTELSAESRQYNEKMLKSINTAVGDMETHSSKPSHQVNKKVEHIGDAVGVLGLMLGMKGAVTAFEHGDIQAGVVGTLQTAHGVAAMTTAVVAKQALSTETRIGKAAAAIMKSPAMRRAMIAVPIVGIGFGVYSLVEDFRRGDTLGYIDAALDATMIALDIVALVQPELAPILIPISLALSVVRIVIDDVYVAIKSELDRLPANAGILQRIGAAFVGLGKGLLRFAIRVASLFYDWGYEEIENGRRLVAQISDHHDYYQITTQDGRTAIDFTSGSASWNGGGIDFCLADQDPAKLCMDYFVSSENSFGKNCWDIYTSGSKDIVLGLGQSHSLEYKTVTKKVLMFIPVGSVRVVSGYETLSNTRYGTYRGNRDSNHFFAVQKSSDQQTMEVMLSYYYNLYGEPGDDIFFLGPQKSHVEGSAGKDTYIIPANGGKTVINNYDPAKEPDTLHFSVDYSHISVSKSGNHVVLTYEGSHTVMIQNWFSGELYRHMTMLSGDGVLFEVSSAIVSRVRLVARGINKMFSKSGQTVKASQPLLQTVTNILGSPFDDVLIGNKENNLIDGGGGRDLLIGGEGEDIYMVTGRQQSTVVVENYSTDNKTDLLILEAALHAVTVTVRGADALLSAVQDNVVFSVTIKNWFRSSADRHLLIVTKDLITSSISENKADCQQRDVFSRCLKSHSMDYSRSTSALKVDLQEDEALNSVTEVRGSNLDDVIKGNKEHNVIYPGSGNDFLEGRGGEDWYIITPSPGSGGKTINNLSPDLDVDVLFLKEEYKNIRCRCQGRSIVLEVRGSKAVTLQNWFVSKNHQHLQIKTSDGVTAGLKTDMSSCGEELLLPSTVDYRNQQPETLPPPHTRPPCYRYRSSHSQDKMLCGKAGKVMRMEEVESVREMYGSSGFDIMVGNNKENVLDPYTGGALMCGGEGKDMYIIKHGYGKDVMIDNFAQDESIDTVLVDMDYLDGGQVLLDSTDEDLNVAIVAKEETLTFSLLNFHRNSKHQHLQFQSSDGVHFKLKALNATLPLFETEAFKVTLKQSQVDCHLDLGSQRNLSKVHTVHSCPSQSNLIVGNREDNALIGGWQDDILDGGDGDDSLIGGRGSDLLIGGMGDDTLYGGDGDDTLMGNSGWDVFIPGAGADVMDGGPGRDTVVYHGDHQKREGVYVNLLTGQGRHADAEGDVLKDVETVIGTIYSDLLVSGYESSLLKGSDGNDVLVSTGEDYLAGGDGNDVYMLAFKDASVTIDNCAKDDAVDILYLSSHSELMFDCRLLPDGVLLDFYGLNQRARVTVKGWSSDRHECGHLVVVFRGVEASVDRLLQECHFRQKEAVWSLIITSVICVSLVLFHCAFVVQFLTKSITAARQQKLQRDTECCVEGENDSMMADET
ncbi:uncharacterized protein LOC115398506 [Salarias fasciatus]|uniref:uncharacterized protein LOC115398506 n=1 Tax=Salarias fasciatus TaxID=181472 RepID=UPI00117682C3|nr:uncharacterized protein LOC115398506 [Salarias fasciatus]